MLIASMTLNEKLAKLHTLLPLAKRLMYLCIALIARPEMHHIEFKASRGQERPKDNVERRTIPFQ